MAAFVGRKALQGLAAGIGLISEASTAHKMKKQQHPLLPQEEAPTYKNMAVHRGEPPAYEAPGEDHMGSTGVTILEEQWALDDVQEELSSTSQPPNVQKDNKSREPVDQVDLAQSFASKYPAPPPYSLYADAPRPQLSAPVVLPQRRPKDRERGFIRAYAPALGNCGIDQDMFLNFLDTAEKSCQAAQWLNAINLASIGTIWLPSITGMAVSVAIQIATDIAIAADGHRK